MKSSNEVSVWLHEKNVATLESLIEHGHEDIDLNSIIDTEMPVKQFEQTEKVVRISDTISDNFHTFWKNKKPYIILKGGRSSLKSSAVSIKLVKKFLEQPEGNVIALRKVAKYLSTSVYEQIKWAIYLLGVQDEFTFLKSPLKIIHNQTDTSFFFYGVDDPLKIKSAKIAIGYIFALWFEEAVEFAGVEEIDIVTDTFIRQELPNDQQVEMYFTYNPPRNPYSWINEWIEEVTYNEDFYIHHSTYKEDTKGFLSKQFIKKVQLVEKNDKDYHDWMYEGKIIGLGDVIYNYNLFNIVEEVPSDDHIILADLAIDSGYSVSATTFLFIGLTRKRRAVLLDTFYYSPVNQVRKKAPSEFSKELWEFAQRNAKKWKVSIDSWTIDSAEGALRNQFFKDYGTFLLPARKKQKIKMIENVEDLLVQDKTYVLNTKNNEVFLDEHKKYRWDQTTLLTADPKVIKEFDHTCDAFQYYVNNNLDKLGLKL